MKKYLAHLGLVAVLAAGIGAALVVGGRSNAAALLTSTCQKGTGQHCQSSTSTSTTTTTVPTTTTAPSGPDLTVNDAWTCSGNVAYGTVTVNVPANSTKDSVTLECSGIIDTLNVNGGPKDGIKVHGLAHDLTIGGGYVTCLPHSVGDHQDGIQVMGGDNVTFNNFNSDCETANNSAVFINSAAGSGGITNFHFNGGEAHGQNCGQVVTIGNSTDSGVTHTKIYDTRVRVNTGAVRPVVEESAQDFLGCV